MAAWRWRRERRSPRALQQLFAVLPVPLRETCSLRQRRRCALETAAGARRLLRPLLLVLLVPCTGATGGNQSCYSEEQWRNQGSLDLTGAFERCGPDKYCIEGHEDCEDYCNTDQECQHYPLRICDGEDFECTHKRLFVSPAGADVGAAFLFFFISGLALSAGIGGGGLYVPLLMVILGFTVREATGLSQACLSGGASTALVYNLRQRHPSGRKPMIDYNLVLVMGPNLLIGALIGSTLNASAPSWLILSVLVVVLCQSAYKTLTKAVATWRKEQAGEVRGLPPQGDARLSKNPIERLLRLVSGGKRYAHFDDGASAAAAAAAGGAVAASSAPANGATIVGKVISNGDEPEKATACSTAASGETSAEDATGVVLSATEGGGAQDAAGCDKAETGAVVLEMPKTPSSSVGGVSSPEAQADAAFEAAARDTPSRTGISEQQFPRLKLAGFGAMWLIMVVSIFARGGKATSGIVPYCSFWYWLFAIVTIALLACVGLVSARYAIADESPREEGDFVWTKESALVTARWSLLAGTLAALCGIGGGMVMGPILLDMGFLPQVQSATTATTLFVMSTSTCIAFLVAGTAPVDYALWLAFATGLGAVCGKAIIGWVVKRFRRPSVIMFLLGGIISTSVVVMFITGIIDVVDDAQNGGNMLFRPFCSSSDDE